MTKKRVRIVLSLDRQTASILQESARQNCRTPEQEIVWLLRRGLLPVNADVMAQQRTADYAPTNVPQQGNAVTA
jgi:hypothetical protein